MTGSIIGFESARVMNILRPETGHFGIGTGRKSLSTTTPEIANDSGDYTTGPGNARLSLRDYLILFLFCSLLFGYVAVSGRPMTLHEARLPETSREMLARGDGLVPMDGDRPWLERPPFPHWCMMAVAKVIGQRCDNEWSVRIPPALAGLLTIFITAQIAARFLGRKIGLISGLLLATMYEFYEYSTQPEDDIFLALLVAAAIALFVTMEFSVDPDGKDERVKLFGFRPWAVAGFFVVLGLTNLAKGPVVGAAVVIAAIGGYFLMPTLLWQAGDLSVIFHFQPEDRLRMRRYLWVWGILAAAVIGLSWHVYIARLYPGAGGYLANLKYDFSMTHEFDEPWWYYPVNLMGRGLPWTPFAVFALVLTARQAWIEQNRAMRFLWCWAIVPIVVLSIPHRKHHHYLVPSLAPWAILAAIGVNALAGQMFKGPAWARRPRFGLLAVALPVAIGIAILGRYCLLDPRPEWRWQLESGGILVGLLVACVWVFYQGLWANKPRWLLAALLVGFGGAYSWSQTHLRDGTVADTQFLRNDVEAAVPKDKLLAVDAGIGPLDFFRVQFYLRPNAMLLHNLSYLRSNRIGAGDIYVVTQVRDANVLQSMGDVDLVSQSSRPAQRDVPHLGLFHLTFAPGLERFSPPKVSPMQAMMREAGPWCGGALPQ
jgi:4-amino-4-deoxy-L-arabinose transferase-like glycosyltransferase